ncbi:Replication factor A protein 2 [Candida viswanathii]|uniref:Replication factor A protein 2 n=1 Tax=Candida viswanathii TaxID=5486 RepID=A0A367XM39_9ASCO|nr:Replication factor A protein 2 [Candida viswanathii]
MSDVSYDQYNGGGGFSTTSQGGFSNDHQGSSQNQKPSQVRQSLTPVTIKQINDATQHVPDAEFKVNNVELNMISFVGVVRKVENTNSTVVVTIEDGTGSIEVRVWISDQVTTAEQETQKYEAMLNQYVFVGGSLKLFNNRKSVQNSSIFPITDSNQILYHHLSAIENHLKAQDGSQKRPTAASGSLFIDDNAGTRTAAAAGSKHTGGSLTDRVLRILKENSTNMQEGVPVGYIVQTLGISREEALKHVNNLIEEGKAYAGYDDESFICI